MKNENINTDIFPEVVLFPRLQKVGAVLGRLCQFLCVKQFASHGDNFNHPLDVEPIYVSQPSLWD